MYSPFSLAFLTIDFLNHSHGIILSFLVPTATIITVCAPNELI